ncbi:MAG: MarR family transcriptional regulator [Actinomycetia bacterium]|nr:MarR family transcriptional regulator [Actinomycetes bacterium]
MADQSANPRGDEEQRRVLLEVVEHLAMIMTESGIPRMPARVFAYVLVDDAEIYTAGQLSDGLEVSPAAISGAVRYLVQVGLIAKQRIPGDRRDHYRIFDDDVFGAMIDQQAPVLQRWADGFAQAREAIGSDSVGGRRLAEGTLFFEFMQSDRTDLLARWHAYRDTHQDPADRPSR